MESKQWTIEGETVDDFILDSDPDAIFVLMLDIDYRFLVAMHPVEDAKSRNEGHREYLFGI